jgi:hypothetical protein
MSYYAIDCAQKTTRMNPMRRFHFVIVILAAILAWLGIAPAFAEMAVLTYNTLFCPSWAEAHERTLASLNNGHPLYPVKWKGCIMLSAERAWTSSISRITPPKLLSAANIGSRTSGRNDGDASIP